MTILETMQTVLLMGTLGKGVLIFLGIIGVLTLFIKMTGAKVSVEVIDTSENSNTVGNEDNREHFPHEVLGKESTEEIRNEVINEVVKEEEQRIVEVIKPNEVKETSTNTPAQKVTETVADMSRNILIRNMLLHTTKKLAVAKLVETDGLTESQAVKDIQKVVRQFDLVWEMKRKCYIYRVNLPELNKEVINEPKAPEESL